MAEFNSGAFSFLEFAEEDTLESRVGMSTIDRVLTHMETGLELDEQTINESIAGWQLYLSFLEAIGNAGLNDFDPENLLRLEFDKGGAIQRVYAAAVMSYAENEDDDPIIVLKLGANMFEVTQTEEGRFLCDQATGTIGFIPAKQENTADRGFIKFRVKGVKDTLYIPMIAPKDEDLSEDDLQSDIEEGISIAHRLRPTGSGEQLILNELIEGNEIQIASIEEQEPHAEYGRSWFLRFTNGAYCYSKGAQMTQLLEKNAAVYIKLLAKGKPITMEITEKSMLTQGIKINVKFHIRAPQGELVIRSKAEQEAFEAAKAESRKGKVRGMVKAAPAPSAIEVEAKQVEVADQFVEEFEETGDVDQALDNVAELQGMPGQVYDSPEKAARETAALKKEKSGVKTAATKATATTSRRGTAAKK